VGKEILYCNKCGKQLLGDDFTRGRAHTFDNRQFCSACLPSTHTPKPMEQPSISSSRIPKRQASSMHLPIQGDAAPATPNSALFVSLAVAGGVVLLLLVLFLNPSKPPATPPEPAAAPRPPEPARKPVEDPVRKAVEQAREFSAGNPHAVDERVRLWEKAVAAASRTPYADEAAKGLERAIAQRKEEFAQELRAVEPKISERLKVEQFGAAVDVLEEARKRHESPEWTAAVATRIRDVQDAADRIFPELKSKAIMAQTTGDAGRVTELRTRLIGWGRRDLLEALDGELSKVLPKEPLPPGAVLLFKYPSDGSPRTYRVYGKVEEKALVSPLYQQHAVLGGFESIREPVPIGEGELWVTYSTDCPKPICVRFRILRGEKTLPYNWSIDKPEVGRPVRVKAPMLKFKDYGNKFLAAGERANTLYFQQDDPKARLIIHEVMIFKPEE